MILQRNCPPSIQHLKYVVVALTFYSTYTLIFFSGLLFLMCSRSLASFHNNPYPDCTLESKTSQKHLKSSLKDAEHLRNIINYTFQVLEGETQQGTPLRGREGGRERERQRQRRKSEAPIIRGCGAAME